MPTIQNRTCSLSSPQRIAGQPSKYQIVPPYVRPSENRYTQKSTRCRNYPPPPPRWSSSYTASYSSFLKHPSTPPGESRRSPSPLSDTTYLTIDKPDILLQDTENCLLISFFCRTKNSQETWKLCIFDNFQPYVFVVGEPQIFWCTRIKFGVEGFKNFRRIRRFSVPSFLSHQRKNSADACGSYGNRNKNRCFNRNSW